MYLTALRLDGFRNIKNQEIFPCGGVNVIFGNNAQGKTNLIEAIFFCSGLGSFRGAKGSGAYPLRAGFFKPFGRLFFKGTKPKNGNQNFKGKKENSAVRSSAKAAFLPLRGIRLRGFFSPTTFLS